MNSGGRGNAYPQGNYPPPQGNYGESMGRGGPPPNRGRGGPPMRPPPVDTAPGGYDPRGDQARDYQNGGPPMGRGGRPAALDRAVTSDPGSELINTPSTSDTKQN